VAQRFSAAISTCHSAGLEPGVLCLPTNPDGIPKAFPTSADCVFLLVNPISSANQLQANEAAKPAATRKAQLQQSTKLPSDTVSLKSTADVDRDGDSH